MKRLKLPLIIVGCLAAVALVAVVLAFTPSVQTWTVRRALTGQPGLTIAVGNVAAGMTSALIGIVMHGGGFLASLLMGAFNARTPVPMTALMCLFGLSGLATYILFRPPAPR